MYELNQAGKNSYYIQSPAKIGLYKLNEAEVCLIDSGSDKDAGRKVRQILDKNGWRLTAVYNTHSNADHIGGNQYLQGQTGCMIYAPGIERDFTNSPVLEPAFLYGGYPPKDLRHKFLMAKPSHAEYLRRENLPEGLSIIPLPGHFFDMIGVRTPDNTVFLADCISSQATLEKYQISFIYDVAQYLDTLDKVENMQADMFVPAHAEATSDIRRLVAFNRNKVYEIADLLLSICKNPLDSESILQKVFEKYNLTMTIEQYVLVGSTVRSYLSWLKDTDKLAFHCRDHKLLWESL